jgi:hypothetical protein
LDAKDKASTAATAKYHKFTTVTRNLNDFAGRGVRRGRDSEEVTGWPHKVLRKKQKRAGTLLDRQEILLCSRPWVGHLRELPCSATQSDQIERAESLLFAFKLQFIRFFETLEDSSIGRSRCEQSGEAWEGPWNN